MQARAEEGADMSQGPGPWGVAWGTSPAAAAGAQRIGSQAACWTAGMVLRCGCVPWCAW